MTNNQKLLFFFAMALAIAGIGFAIGQIDEGVGVPIVIILSTAWTIYAVRRWGEKATG